MQKDLASQIMKAALALGDEINKLDSLVSRIEDEKEKKDFVTALGGIVGYLTHDVMFRIVRKFPDLDPDK